MPPLIDAGLTWLTNGTAIVATCLLSLLMFGFRRYIRRPRSEAIDYIGLGIWLMALAYMGRQLWWDILPDITGFRWSELGVTANRVNWVFNSAMIAGCWAKLKGYRLIVETRAPGQYNTLTCVFYPRRLRLRIVSSGEE